MLRHTPPEEQPVQQLPAQQDQNQFQRWERRQTEMDRIRRAEVERWLGRGQEDQVQGEEGNPPSPFTDQSFEPGAARLRRVPASLHTEGGTALTYGQRIARTIRLQRPELGRMSIWSEARDAFTQARDRVNARLIRDFEHRAREQIEQDTALLHDVRRNGADRETVADLWYRTQEHLTNFPLLLELYQSTTLVNNPRLTQETTEQAHRVMTGLAELHRALSADLRQMQPGQPFLGWGLRVSPPASPEPLEDEEAAQHRRLLENVEQVLRNAERRQEDRDPPPPYEPEENRGRRRDPSPPGRRQRPVREGLEALGAYGQDHIFQAPRQAAPLRHTPPVLHTPPHRRISRSPSPRRRQIRTPSPLQAGARRRPQQQAGASPIFRRPRQLSPVPVQAPPGQIDYARIVRDVTAQLQQQMAAQPALQVPGADVFVRERLLSGQIAYTVIGSVTWNDQDFVERLSHYFPRRAPPRVDRRGAFAFHRDLPEPWNVGVRAPVQGRRPTEFWKMQEHGQLLFDGRKENYPYFRGQFIIHVHQQDCDTSEKCQALITALRSVRRCMPLVQVTQHTEIEYQSIIMGIEKMYGGSEGLMLELKVDLRKLARLKVDNLADLETFVLKARRYVETACTQGQPSECLTSEFTTIISDRLPNAYEYLYGNWAALTQRPRNGLSMVDWCTNTMTSLQLKDTEREAEQAATSTRQDLSGRDSRHPQGQAPPRGAAPAQQRLPQRYVDSRVLRTERIRGNHHLNLDGHVPSPSEDGSEEEWDPPDEYFPDIDWSCVYQTQGQAAGKSSVDKRKNTCPYCEKPHMLRDCKEFQAIDPKDRRDKMREQERCFRCLRSGHKIAECPSKRLCRLCGRKHHVTLHGSKEYHAPVPTRAVVNFSQQRRIDEDDDSDPETLVGALVIETQTTTALVYQVGGPGTRIRRIQMLSHRIVAVWAYKPGTNKRILINVLLDDGSNRTLISTRLAAELGLVGRQAELQLTGVGHATTNFEKSILTQVLLESTDRRHTAKLRGKTIPSPCGELVPVNWNRHKIEWPHLKTLEFPEADYERPIDILLGTDYPSCTVSRKEQPGKGDLQPYARLTPFGWTAIGPVFPAVCHRDEEEDDPQNYVQEVFSLVEMRKDQEEKGQWMSAWVSENVPNGANVYFGDSLVQSKLEASFPASVPQAKKLDQLLLKLIDEDRWPGDKLMDKAPSRDDLDALKLLKRTCRQTEDGHYEVGVLWKVGEPNLPNNLELAKQRLLSLERSHYFRNPDLKRNYLGVFAKWEAQGYLQEVSPEDLGRDQAFYLPHFPVVRTDKQTSKIRPVFDGAATWQGKSLNDAVSAGPKLINTLTVVLLRFRKGRVGIMGDVSDMFLRIKLRPEDYHYHRVLLRKEDGGLRHMHFNRHVFGNAGSPCVAIYVIKAHAEQARDRLPRAAETVLESTLVDDNLDSTDTVVEARQLLQDLQQLYAEMNMEIRKILSSHEAALVDVPADRRALTTAIKDTDCDMEVIKTLGVAWSMDGDAFTFSFEKPVETEWTKRLILKVSYRLYDPLGFLSPYTIRPRMCLQRLWQEKRVWDQEVGDHVEPQWTEWLAELEELPKVRVDRHLHGELSCLDNVEFHTYTDASSQAYAAVTYIVTTKGPLRVSRLAAAKARVAPLNHVTIPRLELMGAYLGARLATEVNLAYGVDPCQMRFFTDSQNVLSWLKTSHRALERFVANRTSKILDLTLEERWAWVDTKSNPADRASRGMSLPDLLQDELWWKGPDGPSAPPDQSLHTATPLEEERINKHRDCGALHPNNFRSWRRMISVWMLVITKQCKMKKRSLERFEIYALVEHHIFRLVQWEQGSTRQAMAEVHRFGQVRPTSPWAEVLPTLDEEGLLRTHGRLDREGALPLENRSLIVLDRDHHVTRLLLQHCHEHIHKHQGGVLQMLTWFMARFWSRGVRTIAKRVKRVCFRCQLLDVRAKPQRMAPLPLFRTPSPDLRVPPFYYCGMDCAGPFTTRLGRGQTRPKRYMLLLTCTMYRAVHLEMLYTMDKASLLMALSRFLARRQRPVLFVTDNGTNFEGAANEFRRIFGAMDSDPDVKIRFPEIGWMFNTPYSPHQGGVFERLVQSAKRALYAVLGSKEDITDEELLTALTIAEGTLNARPISFVETEAGEPAPLTPNHFLGLWSTGLRNDIGPITFQYSYKERWHALQEVMDSYWRRFVSEYVVRLQKLTKWRQSREIHVGETVIILEGEVRGYWPLGVVVATHPGADGLVRNVEVKFRGKVYLRQIQHVIPIRWDQEEMWDARPEHGGSGPLPPAVTQDPEVAT